jgi:hypothetical protein
MDNKKMLEILGLTISFAGVVTGFIIYEMQVCDGYSNSISESSNNLKSESNLEDSYKHELSRLEKQRQNITKRVNTIDEYLRKNQEYINDLDLYLKVDQVKAMASRAIQQAGKQNSPPWEILLQNEGFTLGVPLREIMPIISTSYITNSKPIELILSQPSDAEEFIKKLSSWQLSIDNKYNKFFGELMYVVGENHPKAGKDLENYLIRKLTESQSYISNIKSEISDIEKKLLVTEDNIIKYNNQLKSIEPPFYCKIQNN